MAVLGFWSFDFTDPANEGWVGILSRQTTARTGARSMGVGGNLVLSPSVGNKSTLYAGVAYQQPSLGTGRVMGFYDTGSDQITVTRETDGSLAVRRGSNSGTILAQSAAGVLNTAGIWVHLQLKVVFHGSTGTVELRKEGATIASGSGLNTSATGNARGTNLWLAGPAGTNTAYCDDVWIDDAAWLGDCKIECLTASANGNTNNFTPSTGSNYQNVDDGVSDDGDSTYNSSNTTNDVDLYAMGNLASTVGNIKGAKFSYVSRKDDAGSRSLAGVVRSAGTDYVQATQAQSTTKAVYTDYLLTDPATSTAWTITTINAVESGIKLIV